MTQPPTHADPTPQHERASGFLQRQNARANTEVTDPLPPEATPYSRRAMSWDAERSLREWKPLDLGSAAEPPSWNALPLMCAASCDVGREVAVLRDLWGQDAPLRLSQVGARLSSPGEEIGSWARTENVVALCADRFEWHGIEEWSALLASQGFCLLNAPDTSVLSSRARTQEEALRLERRGLLATAQEESLTVLAGSLAFRRGALAAGRPAVAVCDLGGEPLPPLITPEWQPEPVAAPEEDTAPEEWAPLAARRALEELRPGQRTPAFLCEEDACTLACWFVRQDEAQPKNPLQGVVRVEVRLQAWASQRDASSFASALSMRLLEERPTLARAAQSLRQSLAPSHEVEAEFARLCGL